MFISKKKWQEVQDRLESQQKQIGRLQEDLWKILNPPKYKAGNHKKFIITHVKLIHTLFNGKRWQYHITMLDGLAFIGWENDVTELLRKK